MRIKLRQLIHQHNIDNPEMGLTQEKLHQETGVAQSTLSRMCNNKSKSVSLDVLDKLKTFFGVGIGEILE